MLDNLLLCQPSAVQNYIFSTPGLQATLVSQMHYLSIAMVIAQILTLDSESHVAEREALLKSLLPRMEETESQTQDSVLYIFQQLFTKEEYVGRSALLAHLDSAFIDKLFAMALDST